jgi:hypothetical protein
LRVDELFDIIVDSYDLEEHIAERLELNYEDYSQGAKKTKNIKKLKRTDVLEGHKRRTEGGATVDVALEDLHLAVRYEKGDSVVEDISCNSDYMIEIMPKVGEAIRRSHHWVPRDQWIYLVLDSAGGHGTNEAIAQYKAALERDWKIKLVHQIPQSPDTNVLDLGIWMSLQSAVEKRHRLRRGDKEALHESVMAVWDKVANEEAFVKVFDRLKKNYAIIEKSGGGNDFCEEFRGKKGQEEIAAFRFEGAAEEMGVDLGEAGEEEDGLETEM